MAHFDISKKIRTNAKSMRRQMTDAELKLWNELRAHRLMRLSFRRQMPIGNYIVDFACAEHKLIVEVDGSGHGEEARMRHDIKRTSFLESNGWTVIRFWNDKILQNIDAVCSNIISSLQETGVKFS